MRNRFFPLFALTGAVLCLPIAAAELSAARAVSQEPAATKAQPANAEAQPEKAPIPPPNLALSEMSRGAVRVEIFEHGDQPQPEALETAGGSDFKPAAREDAGAQPSWATLPSQKTDAYTEPAFGFAELTTKYNARGVKVDRSRPFLVRAAAAITLPPGEHRLLLRALTGARVALDGVPLAQTEHAKARYGDAEPVPDQARAQLVPGLRLLPPGHKEKLVPIRGDGQPHVLTLEAFVGAKSIRPEIGELSVSVSIDGGPFVVLTPADLAHAPEMTESGWRAFATAQHMRVAQLNAERRRNPDEDRYWAARHALARERAAPAPEPPALSKEDSARNPIDRFIDAKLQQAGVQPAPLVSDAAFLRRVTLDTIGLPPTPEEITAFLADPAPGKRARAIDRLLADTRWADRWTPYWQDVLAENPNMLKGTLNNTGPFRWWLHEALADNRPMDRFATELIALEGSAQYGGPAGFGLATQNDLPMAAKGQIVASAFLAMEMKCARCHDAPSHRFDQADLFSIAAMLGRAELKVPETSLTKGLSQNSHVTVSLRAGQPIAPQWTLGGGGASEPLPGVLRRAGDTRERLAAIITDPRDARFAQVLVNRLWREWIGVGIVEPVDDWEDALPSHPELLAWLGRELITHGYDWKHVARLILNSDTYQRAPAAEGTRAEQAGERLFASPARRRMTAEQLVDSLFTAAGKDFGCEPLTMDPEGRQSANDQGHLGVPRRAWEWTALSNERDRPALAKPRAQVVADVLAAFGWRESRPEPRSTRDHDANVLQPALLANGIFGARVTRLSEDSAFTAVALKPQPVGALVRGLFLRTLSRPPDDAESERFSALLATGYEDRLTGAPPAPVPRGNTHAVSWANHHDPEATNVILAIEQEVRAGDPPTARLKPEWRERMEDALWALMLSPEFVHLP